ncbi:sigma-70 family RNA polymerase sigma factor [Streptomyces salyersiae]|uniref:Sigma-70 family RNA polymerase sigma factor n=1 Tax=Streptomyces salyersiae TaxID=3075530 RepID=A0ABU2RWL4_9ACTN|nr:sigma-70 family RNA polymerase sigma factor [Streptomyces sp. DSM 41770]MDT0432693.1 sigma-70 family RNA polymerase sigma factor [Streptomyces sp. DSM 41770]
MDDPVSRVRRPGDRESARLRADSRTDAERRNTNDRGNGGRTRKGTEGRHRAGDAVDGRPDALLTAAIRDGGDAGATAELYRRHAPAVLTYARSCCRDPHTAEDLASEAFARTVRAVRDGRGPNDAWRPYLLAVVRHTAADWADQARRVDLAPGFGAWLDAAARREGAEPVSHEADGAEHLVRAEDGDLVTAAFRSLPERWRAVLWHCVVEEEPAARVGTLLGLTPSGVTSLTARAREGLREAYLAAHVSQGAADEECRRCGDRLAAAVRRSRPRRDPALDRHLERCGRCRRAALELTDLNQRLRTILPVAVLLFGGPAYLEARAAAAVAGAPGAAGAGAGAAGAKAAALAVGAAAVLLGGWALWPGGDGPQERPAPVASGPAPTTVAVQAPPAASATVSAPPSPSASASRAAGPSPSPVVPEPGAPALGGPSTLRFVSTGSCMGIAAGAGARPVEAACDGGAHQRWVLLEPYEGDRARTQVRNEATGLCLTRSGGTEDHAPVDQRTCDAALENQLWNLWTDGATAVPWACSLSAGTWSTARRTAPVPSR